jgi:hypothetical protein
MNRIPTATWAEIRIAYTTGIRLREIARNMGIPEGTVLARASREQWTPRIEAAKSMAKPVESAIVPACDAAALTMQARAERHVARIAGITEKVLPHLEAMEPGEILNSARNLERIDSVARRNYGLENQPPASGPVTFNIMAGRMAFQAENPD